MGRLDTRLERLDDLERTLARHPEGLTTGQLARSFGVDPSTIHRDISALERRGTGLVKQGRRWILDHRRALYSVKFTNYELVALFIAARLLWRYSDEQNPHAARALDKLADAISVRSQLVGRNIAATSQAIRARPPRPEYVEAYEALTQGWVERRKVWISYYSGGDESTRSERVFCPYFIEPSGIGYAVYAIGLDELRGEIRTLKLDRMHEARLTELHFDIPNIDDLLQKLTSAWGVVWGEESISVQLLFAARAARRVRESIWHPTQRIQDLPDGSCLFTIEVGSLIEMKPWIRQWGPDVTVVEPAHLRAEIATEAHATAAIYPAD